VILHGWLDQAASWRRVAEQLASEGRRVLAYDQRGHGRSDHAPTGSYYHFPNYVADLDAFVRLLGLDQFTLVGHSMGGTVAARYAALQIPQLKRLVLVDGLGPVAIDDVTATEQYVRHFSQLTNPPRHKPMPNLDAAISRMQRMNPSLTDSDARILALRSTQPVVGGVVWRWDPLHRTRAAIGFDVDRHKLLLSRISVPTTLVLGESGWYSTIPDLDQRIACIPSVTDRIALDAEHAMHLDCPFKLAQAIIEA